MQVGARLRTLALATLLVVASGGLAAAPAQAAGLPAKTVLIDVVGWNGDSSTPGDPLGLPTATISNYWRFNVDTWLESASHGEFDGIGVAPAPLESTIPTPHSDNPDIDFPRCDHQFLDRLADSADAAARTRGVNPDSFDVVVYYFGDFGCVNEESDDFRSAQRGKRLFFQGLALGEAPMRELGHAFGLSPAEALRCTDSAGHPLTLSAMCLRDPQGDVWDLLGNGTGSYSAGNLAALDWLLGLTETVKACDCAVHKTIRALSGGSSPVAVKLQDGQDAAGEPVTYWLEYRRPTGIDEPGHNGTVRFPAPEPGLIVHREVPGPTPGSLPVQQLLDLTPDGDFDHADLPVGQTWSNPNGKMRVTLDAIDVAAGTASITIARQGTLLPDVRYLSQADATRALQDAGLGYRLAFPTIDPYCNNLDDVVTEIPAPGPGKYVPDGSDVTISLGMKDPSHDCPDRTPYLVVNVGWAGGGAVPPSPLEPSKPFFTFLHGAMDTWFNQASLGKFPGFGFIDGGSYTIDTPSLNSSGECDRDFAEEILRKAKLAAAANGWGLFQIRYVVHWQGRACTNVLGLNVPGGGGVLLQGPGSLGALAMHEFGHVLGLWHSALLSCSGPGGVPVPLSNSCTHGTNDDPFDAMGGVPEVDSGRADLYDASQLAALGWLDNRSVTVQAQDVPAIPETIKPLGDTSGGVHAVKLVDGPTTLWIEYRQPIGLDAHGFTDNAAPGLIVHRDIPFDEARFVNQELLDLQPDEPSGHNRWDLPVGQTWANPLGTMKITLDSSDASGAHITIGSNLRTVPNVRGMSLTDARSAIEGAGFVWGGTSQALTSNCELIGSIVGQDPTGNTRQPAGIFVTPAVAALDPRFQCK